VNNGDSSLAGTPSQPKDDIRLLRDITAAEDAIDPSTAPVVRLGQGDYTRDWPTQAEKARMREDRRAILNYIRTQRGRR